MPYSPKVTCGAALGGPGAARVVLLAVLDPAGDQHGQASVLGRRVGRRRVGRSLAAVDGRPLGDASSAVPAHRVLTRRRRPRRRSVGPATASGRRLGTGAGAVTRRPAARPASVPTAGRCRGEPGAGADAALRPALTALAHAGAASAASRSARGLHDVALVDPDLDADAAEGGLGLVDAVVDVRAQRVQRHATLAVELRAAHLGAAEAAGALHPDALDARALLRRLHRLAHRAAEADAAGELLGHALGDELRVGLGVLDLEDVQLHLLAGELLELAADAVGLGAAAADDDARTGGVDVDADAVTGALDLHLGDAGALHALAHQLADGDVFLDVVGVELVGVPAGASSRW